MAFLRVDKGSIPGQILELDGARMVLGRHPSCQIVLDNAAVSRQHAQFLESHGQYYLEDLRSRNSTLLNGEPVAGRTALNDGDQITICDVLFSFLLRIPSGDSPGPAGHDLPVGTSADDPNANVDADTLTNTPALPKSAVGQEAVHDSNDVSSIISTLNVRSGSSLRLNIKPEAKLRAILGIGEALGRTLDLDTILDKILGGLFRIFDKSVPRPRSTSHARGRFYTPSRIRPICRRTSSTYSGSCTYNKCPT